MDPLPFSAAPVPQTKSLNTVRRAAKNCRACPLWKNATQTVFGDGKATAPVILVGEQPGDQEDQTGHPFIGPAGNLLNEALAEAGIARETCYVTNAVKHFKWEARGKRRLHKKPSAREIAACRPWLEAEIRLIQPKVVVCLGATATASVLGPKVRVLRDRGRRFPLPESGVAVVTIHPSLLLRMPDREEARREFKHFVRDLQTAAQLAAK